MDSINEGIKTTGNSVESVAEAYSRNLKANDLHILNFDKCGHLLTEEYGR